MLKFKMNLYLTYLLLGIFLSCQNNKALNQSATVDQDRKTYQLDKYTRANDLESYEQAFFAGGCFWCTEAAFERIEGVADVISGYSGGDEEYPEYYAVGRGETSHCEAICIYYNKDLVDYETLLDVFFIAHDPTTLNRQGPDVGEEYRSAIYYNTDTELEAISRKILEVNESGMYNDPVVTEVAPYKEFWVAEDYHQNYYELHPNDRYVHNVSRPKVEKVKKTFPELLKEKYRK